MVFECNFEFVQRSAIWVLHMKATLIAGDVLSHTDTLACSTVVFASRRRAGFRPAFCVRRAEFYAAETTEFNYFSHELWNRLNVIMTVRFNKPDTMKK